MIEILNSFQLPATWQAVLFLGASILSMGYHYLDRWMTTGERLLDSSQNRWKAYKILVGLYVGSAVWTDMYELTNLEVIASGVTLGLLAFSRGVEEIKNG